MSVTFTKLFSSITESTIWCEPSEIRIVWITMLAMADKEGRIWASIPGLANRAQVKIESVEEALEKFQLPDNYSRTKDFDGKRIEPIDGGWRLLNHGKYRAIRDHEERKEYKREWIKNKRQKEKEVDNVDQGRPQYTNAEADTEAEDNNIVISSPPKTVQKIPYQAIVDLYHEKLPELPKVVKLTNKRKAQIKQRWLNDLEEMEQWENFFSHVSKSDFLMGRKPPTNGRPQFRADIEWLTNETNLTKIAEGKYHV